jgi:hypothetical protein
MMDATFLFLLFLTGCIRPPAPERASPAPPGPASVSRLRLALLPSNATKASKKMLKTSPEWASVRGEFDLDRIFGVFDEALRRNFASASPVRDLSEARASGADLAAVLDVRVSMAKGREDPFSVEASADFLSLDAAPLGRVDAKGEMRMPDSGTRQVGEALEGASALALSRFEPGLRSAAWLREFARGLPFR